MMNLKIKKFSPRLWFLGTGLASATILPISIAASCGVSGQTQKISFDNQMFDSVAELSSFIQRNSSELTSNAETRQYQITEGATKTTYDSFDALANYASSKYLSTKDTFMTKAATQERNGNVLTNETRKYVSNDRLFDTVPITSDVNAIRTIYRGANGQVLFDEKTAKENFIQIHNAFLFDGMYFANKSDLEDYLNNDYDYASLAAPTYYVSDDQNNASLSLTTIPKLPGDNTAIETSETALNQQNIAAFVAANAQLYVKQGQGSAVKFSDFDESTIEEQDLPIFKLDNTNGRSSYMIDIKASQRGSLFGPQVLTTASSPVGRITQADAWEKSTIDMSALKASTDIRQQLFAQFINMRLTAKNNIDNFSDLVFKDLTTLDPAYKAWLAAHPNFANPNFSAASVARLAAFNAANRFRFNFANSGLSIEAGARSIEAILQEGQSYGFVNSISILRSWTLNQLINNGVSSSNLFLFNNAFDNAIYYLNYLVHDGLDQFLSPAAQAFNMTTIFDFANSRNFGEDPLVYMARMESGLVNNVAYPEATEIILATPFATLVVVTADEVRKFNELRAADPIGSRSWSPTPLPTSVEGIKQYVVDRRKLDQDINLGFDSPATNLFDWIAKSWSAFKQADSPNSSQQQALSTLRINSLDFYNLEQRLSEYLKLLKTYWQVINPSGVVSATSVSAPGVSNGFEWEKVTADSLEAYLKNEIAQSANTDKTVLNMTNFKKYIGGDTNIFKVVLVFNNVSALARQLDNNRISKGKDLGLELAKRFTSLRAFSRIASKALLAIAVVDTILNVVLSAIGTVENVTYVYNHNRGEASYYWNGGSVRNHSLFGFTWESENYKIVDNDILLPVNIRSEATQDSYYYVSDLTKAPERARRFATIEQVKKAYLNDLRYYYAMGQVANDFFEYHITLEKDGVYKTLKANTIEALSTAVLASADEFLQKRNSVYGQLFDTSEESRREVNRRILANQEVNPLWIVQLPTKVDDKLKRLEYALPATAELPLYASFSARQWASIKSARLASIDLQATALESLKASDEAANINRTNLYLKFETSVLKSKLSAGQSVSANFVFDQAIIEFDKKFTIDSKRVLLTDLYSQSGEITYDNVPDLLMQGDAPLVLTVFQAKTPSAEVAHFTDRGAARQYILTQLQLTRLNFRSTTTLFSFSGQNFGSLNEAVAWVLAHPENAGRSFN